MKVECLRCGSDVELNADGETMRKHGSMATGRYGCIGSNSRTWINTSTKPKAPTLPGIGKRALAPCGHQGEHVTASMVVCPLGCSGPKPVNAGELWGCRHPVTITFAGTKSCRDCGHVFVRGPAV